MDCEKLIKITITVVGIIVSIQSMMIIASK